MNETGPRTGADATPITPEDVRRIAGPHHVGTANFLDLLMDEKRIETQEALIAALGQRCPAGSVFFQTTDTAKAERLLRLRFSTPAPTTTVVLSKEPADDIRRLLMEALAA